MYSLVSKWNISAIWRPIDFGFRAIDSKFSDAPIDSSISDGTEYRKTEFGYRKSKMLTITRIDFRFRSGTIHGRLRTRRVCRSQE